MVHASVMSYEKSKRRYLPNREQTEIVIDLQDVVDHGSDDLAEAIESNAERYVSRHTMRIMMDAHHYDSFSAHPTVG